MEDKCSGESSKVSISCDIWPRDRPFCLFYCKFFVEFLPSNFQIGTVRTDCTTMFCYEFLAILQLCFFFALFQSSVSRDEFLLSKLTKWNQTDGWTNFCPTSVPAMYVCNVDGVLYNIVSR